MAGRLRSAPNSPRAVSTLAGHYRIMRDFAAAEPLYRRALELRPGDDDLAVELAMVLLAQGRFAEGWALNERRPPRQQFLQHDLSFPEWRGEPLAGKRLFVWREQGFGDQIMMARFLTQVGAAKVTYAGPAALQRLFEQLDLTFMPFGQGRFSIPPSDYWCLPQSLPQRLGVTPQTLPGAPYFTGRPSVSGGRIGVVWKGEAGNANNRFRSLPPEQAQRLLALPGAVSLDPADSGAADFQATADIIAGLDLVISVDTAVAHLAGAMGRPVWVMLARHANDWQWPRRAPRPGTRARGSSCRRRPATGRRWSTRSPRRSGGNHAVEVCLEALSDHLRGDDDGQPHPIRARRRARPGRWSAFLAGRGRGPGDRRGRRPRCVRSARSPPSSPPTP